MRIQHNQCIACLGLLLGFSPAIAQVAFFDAPTTFTGGSPRAIAVGDFNEDGFVDVASADYNDYVGWIMLGHGNGAFNRGATFRVDNGTTSIVAADFNRDGHLDIALTSEWGSSIAVLLGNGDGSFQTPVNYSCGGERPHYLAVADFNGDGYIDIAVTNYGTSTEAVLLGNGNGTFGTPRSYATGFAPFSSAIADVNGDGLPDAIVVNGGSGIGHHGNTVSVLLGYGDGSLLNQLVFTTGYVPTAVAISDFNHDGRSDLAVTNHDGTLSVLLGNGDGTFQTRVDYAVNVASHSIDIEDINADGEADLIVMNSGSYQENDGSISVLLGVGDGTFRNQENFPTHSNPYYAVLVDINRDNKPDILMSNYTLGTLAVFINDILFESGFE